MIKVEEVIITDLNMKGDGKVTPYRSVFEVYSKCGKLLASRDAYADLSIYELIAFVKVCREREQEDVLDILKTWNRPKPKYPESKW